MQKTKIKKLVYLIIFIVTLFFIVSIYLLFYFPIGTFKYSDKNFDVNIYISQSLLTFQDPVYNKTLKITFENKKYQKYFQSQEMAFFVLVIDHNNEKQIKIIDPFIGTSKCQNNKCEDFEYDYLKEEMKIKDSDTIHFIEFNGQEFKIKK